MKSFENIFDGQWIHQLNINGFDHSKTVRSMSLNNSNSTFSPFYFFTHSLLGDVVGIIFNTVERNEKGIIKWFTSENFDLFSNIVFHRIQFNYSKLFTKSIYR